MSPCNPTTKTGTSVDGSGYTMSATADQVNYVATPDGAIIHPSTIPGGGGTIQNRNGNLLSGSAGTYTDTLGTTALTVTGSGTPASPLTLTYTAPSGTSAVFTVKFTAHTVQTNFGCAGIAEYPPTSNNLVSEIDLPDATKYLFAYEPTPGASANVTGRLKSVTLPTGGTITYTYIGANNGIICADGSAADLTRVTPDGTWTYTHTQVSGNHWQTKMTSPLGDDTVLDFQKDSAIPANSTNNFFETQRQTYQGSATSGTLLLTTTTCYNGNTSNCSTTSVSSPITQRSVTKQLSAAGLICKRAYTYNSFGLLTEEDDFDWGSGGPGALLKKVVTAYAALGNGIVDKVASVTIQNGSGTTVAQTTFCYDEGTPSGGTTCAATGSPTATSGTPQHVAISGSRGNATTIAQLVQGTTVLGRKMTYYDTGAINTSTDVNGAVTTFVYGTASCGNAFPTSINEPLSMTRSFAWNCNGGVQSSVIDENGQVTSTTWNDPDFWRPAATNFPDGGQTSITYNSATSVTATTKMNSSQNIVSTVLLDSLGRTKQTQLNSDPQGVDYVDTTYDSLGRVASVSNPHRSTSSATDGITSYQYDALGRTTLVTHPDGSTIQTLYTGPATQVSDEGNGSQRVQRIFQADSLGRVISVCEVSSATLLGNGATPAACGQAIPATGFLTTYQYNALNNLTSASQSGLNPRTYAYDALSRLTSETNPETGTITYAYDASGHVGDLTSRVAPAPNQTGSATVTTTYSYDALHRLTGKTYSDGTPTVTFNYDQASALGVTLTNTKGKMSSESTAGSATTGSVFSYDKLGRIVDNSQCTPQNCGASVFGFQYPQYDLAGDLLSATNAVGITFNYAYDDAARLTTMSTNFVDGSHPGTLFSNAQYGPIGLTSATLGNGLSETLAYMNRGWLKSYSATSGTTTRYSFSVGTFAPNGDILAANDSVNGNWTYTYDAFNRVVGSNQNSGQVVYSYDYDRFGNRWHQNGPHSSSLAFGATNRILSGSGVTYDSAGNVTADGSHTYSYDAENRLTAVDSGSTASYVYDAAGRRVRKTTSSAGSVDFLYDLGGHEVAEVGPGGVFNRGELYLGSRHLATYTSGQSGATFFTHSDWLGTERARTDVSGALAETCTSLPFGDALTCSASDVSPMHFTGDERDSETSLDHTWFRQYSSQFARWTSPDRLRGSISNPQSLNRYAYVANNPLALTDPMGLLPQCREAAKCRPPDPGGSSWYPDTDAWFAQMQYQMACGTSPLANNCLSYAPRPGPNGQTQVFLPGGSITTVDEGKPSNGNSGAVEPSTSTTSFDGEWVTLSGPLSTDEQNIRTIGRGVVKGAGVIGSPKHIAGFYLSSAVLGAMGSAGVLWRAGAELYEEGMGRIIEWQVGDFEGYTNTTEMLNNIINGDLIPVGTSQGAAAGALAGCLLFGEKPCPGLLNHH